ncbi:hypothetical protein [Diaphorobacter sp. J5-51]|uniref:hypothetical protein n=1 Tax=Diaphorobacter sp. J5-51 TaxID=680496 RepID=UPI0006433D80|nr:hypothetical protein [Diaphorobacter sp. J5-51]KLR57425.1 hypothetical protein OX89_12445 [Diaphorobacter sp. J5-51]
MSTPAALSPGQRAYYLPKSGGLKQPALVRKVGNKRVQLAIGPHAIHSHAQAVVDGQWVERFEVQPRVLPVAAFREEMRCSVSGFQLEAWKHPVGNARAFPNGIWYGTIDGYQVGAPCTSDEAAVAAAYGALLHGGYQVALTSAIEHHGMQFGLGTGDADKHRQQIGQLQERLAKVDALLTQGAEPRQVLLARGNPNRGPESGTGHGRWVPVQFLGFAQPEGMQVKCQLLEDDPWAVGAPDKAGDIGLWSMSAVVRWSAKA